MDSFQDKVTVVTGGASGIGKALVRQLLAAGAKVVIGDVEEGALDAAVAELSAGGEVSGVVTDCSSAASVDALATAVYDKYGVCHVLFNNAGVAAPSANIWETTPNDWKWVHSVNVMGVVHGIQSFVPRMIEGGEEGHVINTSSGDGGISPLPFQSVYASSKAAVSIISECLGAQLQTEDTKLQGHLLYPSGGMLDTGIWTTARNRPAELAREKPGIPSPTVEEFKEMAEQAGMKLKFQDLDELARFAMEGILAGRFILMMGVEDAQAQLTDRAQRYGRAELPLDLATLPQI
jgi:NAD(P)-dependent dehydrogenase (short-subunit alcohol dehydrogenase family)